MNKPQALVGMSGGVDSSTAALLLQRQGFAVTGLFMQNWEEGGAHCSVARDLTQAAAVCDALDIPLHTGNFSAEYRRQVFAHFLREQRAGRTPNPDILCNREIKFRFLRRHAERHGIPHIATGHYARLERRGQNPRLLRGQDPHKDQSYFLYAVRGEDLQRTIFPLGGLRKREVRRLAAQAGLPNHARPDSVGICFIGERNFTEFLERWLPRRPGDIVDTQGRILGRHRGLAFYTIGQRRGIGIGGRRSACGSLACGDAAGDNPADSNGNGSGADGGANGDGAWYVVGKDLERNRLQVVQGGDHPALFAERLQLRDIHWLASPPSLPHRCTARIRHRQKDQDCTISSCAAEDVLEMHFAVPQRAVTPGQSAVFYDGDLCLGGGVIEKVLC